MNIFVISSGQDTGGQGYRIKRAFDRLVPDWHVRSMHVTDNFIKYPHDLKWEPVLAQQMYAEADVVHHKNGMAMYERFQGDALTPAIMHHQGTRLRDHAEEVNAEAKSVGAVQIVSTVDLLADVDDGIWLPSPYDLDAIRKQYRHPAGKKLRIGHAPTNRAAKGTDEILAAANRISRWCDLEVDLIEQVPWKVCLSRKGRCDFYIDQVTYGYGNNSIECFAMGVPVISGWNDLNDRDRFVALTGCEPPFLEATADNIEEKIAAMAESVALRDEYAERGRAFAEQFHSEEHVVELLKPIYENAPPSKGLQHLRRFDQSQRNKAERVNNRKHREAVPA